MTTAYENNHYKVVQLIPAREVYVKEAEELHNWATVSLQHDTEEGTFMSLPGAIYAADHLAQYMDQHTNEDNVVQLEPVLN